MELGKRFYIVSMVWIVSILLAAVVLVMQDVSQEDPLIYAEVPAEGAAASMENWQPLMDYLSKKLGRTVELKTVTSYSAVVEALKYGHADIARFGSSGYILAEGEVDLIPIVDIANEDGTLMTYRSYIVTRPGVTSLDGVTFAYVDIGSASGYLYPATYIKKEGIELGETVFAGTHPAVIEAVKNGTVIAGATCNTRIMSALEEGVIEEGELVVFWESEPVARGPIVVHADMDESQRLAIQEAFLSAPVEVVKQCNLQSSRWTLTTPGIYDPVREIQKYIGLGE